MYFLKGKIEEIFDNKIILENNGIGYEILVSRIENFKLSEILKIYIYKHVHEEQSYLVGFVSKNEKDLFLKLIEVTGLGPRTALNILKKCEINEVKSAIGNRNITFFKRISGIGNKLAQQIILDLYTYYAEAKTNNEVYTNVYKSLVELGFKKTQIESTLSSLNTFNTSEESVLKEALIKLRATL